MRSQNRLPALLIFLYVITLFSACSADDPSPELNTAIVPTKHEGRAFERFNTINRRISNLQGDLGILLVGDSITERWETTGSEVWNQYFEQLNTLNIGISGDRTQHVLWRLKNGNIDSISPKITVLLIGTNNITSERNSAQETLAGINKVVEQLLDGLPGTTLILYGIFPRGTEFNEMRGEITQINQALKNWEQHDRVGFIDIGHLFLDNDGNIPNEIMPDALHLSKQGYKIWAESMAPIINEILDN